LVCWYWRNLWPSMLNLSFVLFILVELLTITVKTFFCFVKRKFDQWWSTLPPISTKQKKVFTVMVNNSTNINKTKQSFNIDGQQFYQYQQNKRKI
jgi:hypothetical protein